MEFVFYWQEGIDLPLLMVSLRRRAIFIFCENFNHTKFLRALNCRIFFSFFFLYFVFSSYNS